MQKHDRENLAWSVALILGGLWVFTLFRLVGARSRLLVYEEGLGLKAHYAMLAEDLRDAVAAPNK